MVQILPRSWILRFTGLGKVRETPNRVATVDSVADAGSWRFQFLARTRADRNEALFRAPFGCLSRRVR